ncbi:MAG: glycoside hydrolase family 97 catalytic domain-containing protein [Bacteroidota bacterium]|nr:glycoside hydrolase family 97 catalytic domain-containing protein [Bacteroidota bacterium]
MKKIHFLLFITSLIGLFFVQCNKKQEGTTVISIPAPDSVLQFNIFLEPSKNSLVYNIIYNNDTVVRNSQMGLIRSDVSFAEGLSIVSVSGLTQKTETYTMVAGKRKQNAANYKETIITLKASSGALLNLVARVYNEGIAFRYIFPENSSDSLTIIKETTTFSIPKGRAWLQPHGLPTGWGPAYEAYYPEIAVGQAAPDSSGYSFPALFNTVNNKWLLVTEADLEGNYFGARLNQNCDNGIYAIRKPMVGDGLGTGNISPVSVLPWQMPWRTIIISNQAVGIANSNLVHHLATPSKVNDVSWIKPGRASWSWWGEHDSPKDFKRLKLYVDLAKSLGWEYSLIDANWDLMKNGGTIEDLAKYANSQGVGLLLWYNSGGPHNNVTERPRDIMNDATKRKEEFKKLATWGVKGVKIDFFQSDKQNLIQLYRDILQDAAEAKILVVFHGCTLPRGWSRTFPNLMSMEAIMGGEQYSWPNPFVVKAAWHNAVVPFTRNVVGPMDYTPATFSDYEHGPHQTTNAHELALTVLYESGILHWADRVDSYNKQTPDIKKVMSAIPAAWDDTQFLIGDPGKLVVVARKSGDDWFVAGINGDSTSKEVTVNLPFIKESKSMMLYADGTAGRDIVYSQSTISSDGNIKLNLLPKGGFLGWIKK